MNEQDRVAVARITAKGHKNITARHKTTFEITPEKDMTLRGDCIVAVCADKALHQLPENFKNYFKNKNSKLHIKLISGGISEEIEAQGHPGLTFEKDEMVIRKSDYTCERTLAVKADKSAAEFNREFVEKLKQGNSVEIILSVFRMPKQS